MRTLLLLSLGLGCARLGACGEAPAPTVDEPVAAPAAPAWAHAWRWAVVVRVDPAVAAPDEVRLAAEAGASAPDAVAERATLPLDLTLVRDGLAGAPVSLVHAAPGQVLDLPVPGGEDPDARVAFTVPAPPDQVEGAAAEGAAAEGASAEGAAAEGASAEGAAAEGAAAEGAAAEGAGAEVRWLVATDQGQRWLSWPAGARLREVEVALGLQPWRVLVDADPEQDLAAGPGAEGRVDVLERLAEQGVVVLSAPPAGELLAVPWDDAPLDHLDVSAVLRAGGVDGGWVVAEAGRSPEVLDGGPPLMLLHQAGAWFQVDLTPVAGAQDGRGPATRLGGPGREGKLGKSRLQGAGKDGKAGKLGKLGKAGKAGKLRGKAGGGGQAPDEAAPADGGAP